jgi:hypothetical protein
VCRTANGQQQYILLHFRHMHVSDLNFVTNNVFKKFVLAECAAVVHFAFTDL